MLEVTWSDYRVGSSNPIKILLKIKNKIILKLECNLKGWTHYKNIFMYFISTLSFYAVLPKGWNEIMKTNTS